MRFTLSAAALLAALALPAAAATNTGLGGPSLDGFNVDDDEFGWRFIAEAELTVTELGFYAVTPGTTTVRLWDADTVSLIADVVVEADDTGWYWAALAAPETLLEDGAYAVSFGGGGLGGGYAVDGNYTVNSLLTFTGNYLAGTPGDYPITAVPGGIYLADIGFETAAATPVPVPAAAPLALLGLAALGVAGRRRRG